jgi:hypothetical protein
VSSSVPCLPAGRFVNAMTEKYGHEGHHEAQSSPRVRFKEQDKLATQVDCGSIATAHKNQDGLAFEIENETYATRFCQRIVRWFDLHGKVGTDVKGF